MPALIGFFSNKKNNVNCFQDFAVLNTPFSLRKNDVNSGILLSHSFSGKEINSYGDCLLAGDGQRYLYELIEKKAERLVNHLLKDSFSHEFNYGNVYCYFKNENKSILRADSLASLPLYYYFNEDEFIFSSRLKLLAKFISAVPCEKNILQFIRSGYTTVGTTIFKNIYKLKPGEQLTYCHVNKSIKREQKSTLWTKDNKINVNDQGALNDGLGEVESFFSQSNKESGSQMLMTSGGWDSRTLLALSCNSIQGRSTTSYYHGDTESREFSIVKRLAAIANNKLLSAPLTESTYSVAALEDNLDHTENTIFPHWHQAGSVACENKLGAICSGVFGESIGGHYGPPMVLPPIKKILMLNLYLLGLKKSKVSNSIEPAELIQEASAHLLPNSVEKMWFYNSEFWCDQLSDYHEQIKPQILSTLGGYSSRGVGTVEDIIEAYITEHRGSQYINAQMISCRKHVDVSYPFGSGPMMALATSIPFSMKVHNILNQSIIRLNAPELLCCPTAASLVDASRPISIQELSRIARKVYEIAAEKTEKILPTASIRPHYGWANLQFLTNSNVFNEIIDSLNDSRWDKPAMQVFANNYKAVNGHSLMDMLLKIKTVDYLLN